MPVLGLAGCHSREMKKIDAGTWIELIRQSVSPRTATGASSLDADICQSCTASPCCDNVQNRKIQGSKFQTMASGLEVFHLFRCSTHTHRKAQVKSHFFLSFCPAATARPPRVHWFHRSRHGEAANPGPAAPGTPLCGERPRQRSLSPRSPRPAQVSGMDVDGRGPHSGSRVFCPVPGLPLLGAFAYQGMVQRHHHAEPRRRPHGWHAGRCYPRSLAAATWPATLCRLWAQCFQPVWGAPNLPSRSPGGRSGPNNAAASGDGFPPFEAIQGGNTPTLRHVPQAARHSRSKALTRALAAVAHSNAYSAWRELLMLPQTVLDAPPRGGKKHKKALVAHSRRERVASASLAQGGLPTRKRKLRKVCAPESSPKTLQVVSLPEVWASLAQRPVLRHSGWFLELLVGRGVLGIKPCFWQVWTFLRRL